MAKKTPFAPRQAMAPEYQNMSCLNCGQPHVAALLDKRGIAYLRCNICRFRILGLDPGQVQVFRFLSDLMKNQLFYSAWNRVRTSAPAAAQEAIQTEATKVMEGVGV